MALDQTTLQIEKLYLETGSYRDAFLEFAARFEIYDYEDILKVINPILYEKIKQEFIDNNCFRDKKRGPSVLDFMKD
jgi:hypothetical protein